MTDTLEERLAMRPPSVGAMLLDQVEASGPREAFRYLDGNDWVSLSWDQTKDRVFTLAAGLIALGIEPEDRVAIASSTRIEWILADLAVMCAAAATTTVYPTTQHEDVAYILADSDSRLVFAEDADQVEKVLRHADGLGAVTKVVLIDGPPAGDRVIGWRQLEDLGREYLADHPYCVDQTIAKVGPESLSTLIYTSGTTGRPKGVRLVQDSWTYLGAAIEEWGILDRTDVQYLWLPLSHVFGKCLIAVQLKIGFATAVDGRVDKIVDNLAQVRPTFMAGAPRIFEKVRTRVLTSAASGPRRAIFGWAFGVGRRTGQLRLQGRRPRGLLAVEQAVAERLVFGKIKQRMGGRIRFFISGSAALSREVQEWFYAAGVLVLEGYGLTESSAASFVNDPRTPRLGMVGPPIPGTSVRIAEDGEILIKGPAVMRGYHHLDEATAEVLRDGWLYTGDIGELDDDNYLRITDRKKDLIKTSGGKYVAPQKVEGALKAACPYVSQVVVHGEGRKYVTALLTLDPDAITEWARGHEESVDYAKLVGSARVRELLAASVLEANKSLERWETIKRFEILPEELSVEGGEMTPSMKVRRAQVERKYRPLLDSLYDPD